MLPGVYLAKKKNGTVYYRSNITHQGKHISLGSYPTELQAHEAYLEAREILSQNRVTLEHLDQLHSQLPFDKIISLLNYRDNHIYFKNPIYLKTNYFLYYISKNDELKFDADDLFYYSSHKLMRRKGHLFVSEYGMQTNILSRYGIKNHAVCGRDYRFVNGDTSDFRYSNLEIINKYYGVQQIESQNRLRYKAKLNIVGTHVLGIYKTEIEAAIAYNKAIDLAKSHGIRKEYTANYILDLSPPDYAQIYTTVPLSRRFLDYLKQHS